MKLDRDRLFNVYMGLYEELVFLMEKMHLGEEDLSIPDFIETEYDIQTHINAMTHVNLKAAEMKFKTFSPISIKHDLYNC